MSRGQNSPRCTRPAKLKCSSIEQATKWPFYSNLPFLISHSFLCFIQIRADILFQHRCFAVVELLMKMLFGNNMPSFFLSVHKKEQEREKEREREMTEKNICAFNLRGSPLNKLSTV